MMPEYRLQELMAFIKAERAEQSRILGGMSMMDMLAFDAAFELWAHRGQLPPMGEGWRTWLLMAGRGFGKTRAGAEWIHRLALHRPVRIALVAASIDEGRRVMIEGMSGLLAVAKRGQQPRESLPASLTIRYHDVDRDYQTGQMRASAEGSGRHEALDLAAAMNASAAKALTESSLARRWSERDRVTLRLPPSQIAMVPGTLVRMPETPGTWTVEQMVLESIAVIVRLKPVWSAIGAIAAAPGRYLSSPDEIAEPTQLALLDLPDFGIAQQNAPAIQIAAGTSGRWRPVPLEIAIGPDMVTIQSALTEAIVGRTSTPLPAAGSALLDLRNSVEVELADAEHWLEGCDDAALANGANLAAIGGEVIQFGGAEAIGPGVFQLTRLLRGRRGSEWAASHVAGESFAMLSADALKSVEIPIERLGEEISVRAIGIGDGPGDWLTVLPSGEALRPPSPVHLVIAQKHGGSLDIRWVRRSRSGWAWIDEMDAPIGETVERYRIRIEGPDGSIERDTSDTCLVLSASEVAGLGTGPGRVDLRQLGDRLPSRPATGHLTLS